MDGSRIRNKTVSFSIENGVVWTGSQSFVKNPIKRLEGRQNNRASKHSGTSFDRLHKVVAAPITLLINTSLMSGQVPA